MNANIQEVGVNANGKRVVRFTVSAEPTFDLLLFRRGLHHVALNHLAYLRGASTVLTEELDEARRYVREPRRGEAWPFGERDGAGEAVPRSASVSLLPPAPEFTIIQIFHREFLVDLYHRPSFSTDAKEKGFVVCEPDTSQIGPASLTYVEDEPPAAAP